MYTILCFGDSNTFGTNPSGGRWPWEQRWPGALQQRLGGSCRVIEEGCGGRTAMMPDPLEGDRNGYEHLGVALHSHRPLDLVVLMLGTNDMKQRFNLLPVDIALGAAQLGHLVERYDYGPNCPIPKVLLVSPIHLGPGIEHSVFTGFAESAVGLSHRLAPYYEAQAKANGWYFLDAARYARPSKLDMLHMESADHQALAAAMEQAIRGIFPDLS